MNINTHSIKSMDPKFSQSDRTVGKRKDQFTKHRITVMAFWLWYRTVCMYQSLPTMRWHSLLIMRFQLPMLVTMNDFDVIPLSKRETFSKEFVSSIFRVMFPLSRICRQQVLVKYWHGVTPQKTSSWRTDHLNYQRYILPLSKIVIIYYKLNISQFNCNLYY